MQHGTVGLLTFLLFDSRLLDLFFILSEGQYPDKPPLLPDRYVHGLWDDVQ